MDRTRDLGDGREATIVTWSRRGLALVALVGEVVATIGLARADESIDRPMLLLVAVASMFGLALAILVPARWMTLTRGPTDRLMTGRVRRDLGWMLLVGVLTSVAGAALYPQTFRPGESHDPSWFAVVLAVGLLVGPTSSVVAYIVLGLLVVKPFENLVTRGPAALRGDPGARRTIVVSLVLLAVVPLSVFLALGGAPIGPGGRAGLGSLLATLLGISGGDAVWLWSARLVALLLAVLLWIAVRQERQQSRPEGQDLG